MAADHSTDVPRSQPLCRRPVSAVDPGLHTMGMRLVPYVHSRVHAAARTADAVIVRGSDGRDGVPPSEKRGKLFNWMRPCADIDNGRVTLNVFPGRDYTLHYAMMVATYHRTSGVPVMWESPECDAALAALRRSNLMAFPGCDVVVLGYVAELARLLTRDAKWVGNGTFGWRLASLRGRPVAFVGCRHSYWGDILGDVVSVLIERGARMIIYCGKLGTLRRAIAPNYHLACGTQSQMGSTTIEWENVFAGCPITMLAGRHVTVPSVMQESKAWAMAASRDFDFVDPEIGPAAAACAGAAAFGYLHIVTDNLVGPFDHDLSNEHLPAVKRARACRLKEVAGAIMWAVGRM